MRSALAGALLAGGGGGGGGTTVIDAGLADDVSWVDGAAIIWTNEPDADTEIFGNLNRRKVINAAGRETVTPYVAGTVPAGPGSIVKLMYSLDAGATWREFTGVASVSTDNLAAGTSTNIGTTRVIPLEARITNLMCTWFGNADATPTEDPAITTLGAIFA
mgnify:CR=1 FL=1